MISAFSEFVSSLIVYAGEYGINPIVYLVIYFGSTPFILIPVYFLSKKSVNKKSSQGLLLIAILVFGVLMPYLYVIIFGRDINIAIRILVVVVALFFLTLGLRKIDIKPSDIIKKIIGKTS